MGKSKITINIVKRAEKLKEEQSEKVLEKLVQSLKDATPEDTGFAKSQWKIEGKAIVNDADYVSNLNQGTSQQAPAFFVEKTLLSQEGIIPNGTIVTLKS